MRGHYWVLPLILLTIVSVLWFFRWEQGPTHTDKGTTTTYKTDRWSGTSWTVTYGTSSVTSEPVIPDEDVAIVCQRIASEPDYVKISQEISERIKVAEEIAAAHAAGHNEYERLLNIEKQKIEEQNRQAWDFTGGFIPHDVYRYTLEDSTNIINLENLSISKPLYGPEQTVLEDILEHQSAWRNEQDVIFALNKEAGDMNANINAQAKSELTTWAWQLRNLLTYIWIVTAIILATSTLILVGKKIKSPPKEKES